MKYAVILYDGRNDTITLIECGLTKDGADIEVKGLRGDGLPAFHLTHTEYRKRFGAWPREDVAQHGAQ